MAELFRHSSESMGSTLIFIQTQISQVQCIRTITQTCPDEKSKSLKSDSTTSTPRWDALVLTTAMDWGWQRLSTRNSGVSVHLHCLCVLGCKREREVRRKLRELKQGWMTVISNGPLKEAKGLLLHTNCLFGTWVHGLYIAQLVFLQGCSHLERSHCCSMN